MSDHCKGCAGEWIESVTVYATRDMAIDAGDRALEGMPIEEQHRVTCAGVDAPEDPPAAYLCDECGWQWRPPGRVSIEVVIDAHFHSARTFHAAIKPLFRRAVRA